MGLTTWKNAPHGPIRKADVTVAKNYLSQPEITELNRVVTTYLDFAEDVKRLEVSAAPTPPRGVKRAAKKAVRSVRRKAGKGD